MKALKAFIKPFEAPQRNMKIKISVNFYLIQHSEMLGAGRVNKVQHFQLVFKEQSRAFSFSH